MTVSRGGVAAVCGITQALYASAAWAAPAEGIVDRPLVLVLGLALVGLLPFAFMALTSFLKISTVLQIVRSALGTQSVPSTTVIMALSAALSLLAMAPVGTELAERLEPVVTAPSQETATLVRDVMKATAEPLRGFLKRNASDKETARFYQLARDVRPEDQRDVVSADDFSVVIPAFMVSELVAAFTLGFAIFLPFLVIDLVVGNVLLALGMQMMSPAQVSLPFKLLLFIAADGWGLLAQTLIGSYNG